MNKNIFISAKAVVEGDVTIGEGSGVWHFASVRGDLAPIVIGKNTNIQENCTLHVDTGVPLTLGDGITCGHGAILHGCEIGDNSLIGMGAIVLNGAKIGKNCIVGAGALVTGGTVVPDGSLVLGSPAKVKRELTEDEIKANKNNADEYVKLAMKRI
ncbi:MAG: gamma carbonic anhydrase family protein [Clostridia bacterium]|nr:gamma carbonic anhydrase family protein [Clostridia bacterium]